MAAPTYSIGYTWTGGARVTPSRMNLQVTGLSINVSGPGRFPVRALASVGAGAVDEEGDLADLITTRSRPSRLQINGLTALAYAATVDINFDTGTDLCTIPLAGNLTLTTSNKGAGKSKVIRIVADASVRTLTFPSGGSLWKWVSAMPASIAANKTGQLVLMNYGTTDAEIVAAWAVEA
jgi:hypothetical protein